MKVIADICVVPLGVGVSLSRYIAACQDIFEQAGLEPRVHGYGSNVEGEFDVVMAALEACHERLHELGVPRVSTNLRLGTRSDRAQTLDDKLESLARERGR